MIALLTGNPVDGFKIKGVFAETEDAIEYAENARLGGDWWITPVEEPPAGTEGAVMAPEAVTPLWYVIDNVTGGRVSRGYDTYGAALRICAAYNVDTTTGERYGVEEQQP